MEIPLTNEEATLKKQIKEDVDKLWKMINNRQLPRDNYQIIESHMGDLAHKLHLSLKDRGLEPKHHKYMIKNRGLQPFDPEFYKHIHPTEDLLKYLENPHANDDPEDVTIGETFEFHVYSRRWGHDDVYKLTRTENGWHFQFAGYGECDKGGNPYLFKSLEHDLIFYPNGLDGHFEWLWKQAHENGLSKEQVQEAINELASWVSKTEKDTPCTGVWAGYC